MTRLPLALLLALAVAGCVTTSPGGGSGCPRDAVLVEQDVAVGDLVGGGRVGPGDSQEVPVDVSTVPVACVRSITATLRWTNTPDSGADLYLGLEAPGAGVSALGHDDQQLVADGAHEESVSAPVAASDAAGLSPGVTVVIHSDWASLSQNGVPAHLSVAFGMAG
jgi:hypothetical protein